MRAFILGPRGMFVPFLIEVDVAEVIGTFDGELIGIKRFDEYTAGMVVWSVAVDRDMMSDDFRNMYPFAIHNIPFEAAKGWVRCKHT